ncbi:MAG: glycosyltransferase family 4 protein [Candidatus Hodarchaeota archaeon]
MKVLIITPSPPEYLGGLALFCRDLALNLEKKGIEVDILTSTLSKKGPIIDQIGLNINVLKQKVYAFPDNDNFLRIKNPLFLVLKYLKKNANKYDLIHVHSYIYFATIQTFIYRLLFNQKIPVILHLHGGIQTEEFIASSLIEKAMLLIKKFFFDLIIGKFMIKRANAIISVSKEDLLAVNNVFKSNRKTHNFYIPNVVDSKEFKRLDKIDKKYIGFIGRLTKIKGIDLFLELIKKINEIDRNQEFLIIGEGPYLNDVKKANEKYPIKFLERVNHSEIVKYYNQCSIFVQTSRAEGLPTCVLEALSCEIPVVASDVGGTSEIVQHNKTGYLFENGMLDQAIEFINKIKNNQEYAKLGKIGRALIRQKFSWEAITKKIILIYKKVLKNSPFT